MKAPCPVPVGGLAFVLSHSVRCGGRLAWPVLVALGVSFGWSVARAATVTWDGGGGDASWENALNWSPDGVPQFGDDVVVPGTPAETVVITGFAVLRTMETGRSVEISGGSLGVTAGRSRIGGGVIVEDDGSLRVMGEGAELEVAGSLRGGRGYVGASDGARLTFSASGGLEATGRLFVDARDAGSRIRFTGLTEVVTTPDQGEIDLVARLGAAVDLGAAKVLRGVVRLDSQGGGSVIDASAVEIFAAGAGERGTGRIGVAGGAAILLSRLSRLEAAKGLALGAAGAASRLTFPALVEVVGGEGTALLEIGAGGGGRLEFSQLRRVEGAVTVSAYGDGSVVEWSGPLDQWVIPGDGRLCEMIAEQGGAIEVPRLQDISLAAGGWRVSARGAGSRVVLSGLERLTAGEGADPVQWTAQGGGYVGLERLERVEGQVWIRALGPGSQVAMTAASGQWVARGQGAGSQVTASFGGEVMMPGWSRVTLTEGATLMMLAEGAGGLLDLSGLRDLEGPADAFIPSLQLTATGGGTLKGGTLRRVAAHVQVQAMGRDSRCAFPAPAKGWSCSVEAGRWVMQASAGGSVQLPDLEAILGGGGSVQFIADGVGSTVNLAGLETLSAWNVNLLASTGGTLDCRAVQGIACGSGSVLAEGVASLIDLRALTAFTASGAGTAIHELGGGQVRLGAEGGLLTTVFTGQVGPDGLPRVSLSLSGRVGASYQVETRDASVSGSSWTLWRRVPVQESPSDLAEPPTMGRVYRASVLVANPPVLDLVRDGNQGLQLVVFGEPGRTVVIESASGLPAGVGDWQVGESMTLERSFQVVEELSSGGSIGFYRVRQP